MKPRGVDPQHDRLRTLIYRVRVKSDRKAAAEMSERMDSMSDHDMELLSVSEKMTPHQIELLTPEDLK